MSALSEEFERKSDFCCEKGATEEEIKKAQETLGQVFADDYKEYLRLYGSASCGGHELTGISAEESLNVVQVTIDNRRRNPSIKTPLYVVEETHIDGIVIWQASTGEVYQTEYKNVPQKTYASLIEYVATFRDSRKEDSQ